MASRAASLATLQDIIRGVQSGFSAFYAKVLAPHEVTFPQFAVLAALARQRPRKMSEVAGLLHVSLPAVTNLVDRLEQKRFIRRKPHPKDRRVTLLDLTPKGRTLVAHTQGRALKILTRAYLRRKPSERKVVFEFMQALDTGLWKVIKDAKALP